MTTPSAAALPGAPAAAARTSRPATSAELRRRLGTGHLGCGDGRGTRGCVERREQVGVDQVDLDRADPAGVVAEEAAPAAKAGELAPQPLVVGIELQQPQGALGLGVGFDPEA